MCNIAWYYIAATYDLNCHVNMTSILTIQCHARYIKVIDKYNDNLITLILRTYQFSPFYCATKREWENVNGHSLQYNKGILGKIMSYREDNINNYNTWIH